MAPDTSGESFIWLLWNWFCDPDVINFDYQPGDKIYHQIAAFLENEFGGESDLNEDVSLEGKTYSIKSSFKYLFTQDKDSGIKLLDKFIRHLMKYILTENTLQPLILQNFAMPS